MKRLLQNQQGLTLIEVMISLAIIGIIGAIVIPSTGIVSNNRARSIANQLSMDMRKMSLLAKTNHNPTPYNTYTISFDTLPYEMHNPVTSYPEIDIPQATIKIEYKQGAAWTEVFPNPANELDELQFDNRGRVQILLSDASILTYENYQRLRITIDVQGSKKYIDVNALTGGAFVTNDLPSD